MYPTLLEFKMTYHPYAGNSSSSIEMSRERVQVNPEREEGRAEEVGGEEGSQRDCERPGTKRGTRG